ncbi:SRPBCC domain-containing protein [Hoeflea sp. YIM 152468]|uniref:SRPBCC family protein n=1 Tax=Hoeflea sp. YIM 152468 TaxID=3031759 RepID=UPI0023D9FCC6|nr:SRPBCC domain-containing protein [Hoeflea sp. YIM 152468]MDF1607236.1 SRPBCC domain-containing protein [Hoeflea sp. YIM 152468]
MSDLRLERTFPHPPERVFAFVTEARHLLSWWGPEGMSLREHQLDLSRPGAWFTTLVNPEGGLHKMSGVVLEIDPPRSVEFTWGWHDAEDIRGRESRVRFEIEPDGTTGSRFRLIHSGLADATSVSNHSRGWSSMLGKLERLAGAT